MTSASLGDRAVVLAEDHRPKDWSITSFPFEWATRTYHFNAANCAHCAERLRFFDLVLLDLRLNLSGEAAPLVGGLDRKPGSFPSSECGRAAFQYGAVPD